MELKAEPQALMFSIVFRKLPRISTHLFDLQNKFIVIYFRLKQERSPTQTRLQENGTPRKPPAYASALS